MVNSILLYFLSTTPYSSCSSTSSEQLLFCGRNNFAKGARIFLVANFVKGPTFDGRRGSRPPTFRAVRLRAVGLQGATSSHRGA